MLVLIIDIVEKAISCYMQERDYKAQRVNKFSKIDGIKRHRKFDVWDNQLSESSDRDVNLYLPYL